MDHARINGINIAFELRGAGAPLVMIHGAQGDQTMFAGQLTGKLAQKEMWLLKTRSRDNAQKHFALGRPTNNDLNFRPAMAGV